MFDHPSAGMEVCVPTTPLKGMSECFSDFQNRIAIALHMCILMLLSQSLINHLCILKKSIERGTLVLCIWSDVHLEWAFVNTALATTLY